MLPGPDQVLACPHCAEAERVFTLMSGNTFGATLWSDGKPDAPMLPRPPAITRCHACNEFYWLEDADELGEVAPWMPPESAEAAAWLQAPEARPLSEDELLEAIAAGLGSYPERVSELRTFAWWAGNDARRIPAGDASTRMSAPPRSPAAVANMESLIGILAKEPADDPEEVLMKAELLRELGRFDEALQLLDSGLPEELSLFTDYLRRLATDSDAEVREIPERE
jgi:hypothetical protein